MNHQVAADALRILSKTLLLHLLIFLPGAAMCASAVRAGIRGTLKLGLILLASIALPGYVLFNVYLASPRAGYFISSALPFLAGGSLLLLLFKMHAQERRRLLPLLFPILLILFVSMSALSFGYLYGGQGQPEQTAQTRFSHSLPPDNILPLLFAEGVRQGSVPRPLLGDWLSSDRPPLQAGMILALEPFIESRRQLKYQIASVVVESLWILALWLMLRAFRISRLTWALVVLTITFSGFAIVNSFFVWPKLLAAAYTLAFAIPVLIFRTRANHPRWWLRVLVAFLLACGLLSHGGSLFALLGILAFLLASCFRKLPISAACTIGMLTLVFYAPWLCYQMFADPPGDRLIKMHFAGVEQLTSEPAIATIVDSYRKLTLSEWIAAKQANVGVLFTRQKDFLSALGTSNESVQQMRGHIFFYFMPALGFVSVGLLGLLIKPKHKARQKERSAALRLTGLTLFIAIPTVLLMFSPSSTVLHQTSYVMMLTAFSASVLAFRSVAPKLAIVVCAAQIIWTWTLYQPDLRTLTLPHYAPVPMNAWMMALHLASLAGIISVLAYQTRLNGNRAKPLRLLRLPAVHAVRLPSAK